MLQIARAANKTSAPLVFTDDIDTTAGFSMELYAGAVLFVGDCSNDGTIDLTFGAKLGSSDLTVFTLADRTNEPIVFTVEGGRCYALPDELFACGWVMPITNTGTVTAYMAYKA